MREQCNGVCRVNLVCSGPREGAAADCPSVAKSHPLQIASHFFVQATQDDGRQRPMLSTFMSFYKYPDNVQRSADSFSNLRRLTIDKTVVSALRAIYKLVHHTKCAQCVVPSFKLKFGFTPHKTHVINDKRPKRAVEGKEGQQVLFLQELLV